MMANATQNTILLTTNKGEKGYRINKFQIMPNALGDNNDQEHVVMIWKTDMTDELGTNKTSRADFSDNRLLAVGYVVNDISTSLHYSENVIFDNEIFNQDIFITLRDVAGGAQACNYYLELEMIPLNEMEATVATLKDIRNNA
jgi:hypothetical protein